MSYAITSHGLDQATDSVELVRTNTDGTQDVVCYQDVFYIKSQTISKQELISGQTPDFHKRLSEGKLIHFTERHVKKEVCNVQVATSSGQIVNPDGSYVTEHGPASAPYYFAASFPSTSSTPETDVSVGYSPLLTKALGEAKAGATMILLELAESPKVVQLFANFAQRLRKRRQWLHDLLMKKYRPRRYKDYHRIFNDMWLEYRYGWRQLYYTGEDILRSLEILSQGKHFTVVTGRGYASGSLPGEMSNFQFANGCYGGQSRTDDIAVTVEKRAAVAMQVYTLNAAVDLNLLSLGWELIPYSFVVDWFVNVGDVARAVWPVPHMDMTACTSWKKSSRVSVSYTRAPQGGITTGNGELYYTREEYKRTPFLEEIPIVFDVKWDLGLDQIRDLLALTKSQYKAHNKTPFRL